MTTLEIRVDFFTCTCDGPTKIAPSWHAPHCAVLASETPALAALGVLLERQRQITVEGFTDAHDDIRESSEELTRAAACYALGEPSLRDSNRHKFHLWPWETRWWKPSGRIRNLEKAGALILAALEMEYRAASRGTAYINLSERTGSKIEGGT